MKQPKSTNQGFTLIELSIVLVIIGLIIGGILTGQDLINAAAIRAQIAQIEKYNTAVHTFQGKYGYLPGDIPDPYATQFGFGTRGTSEGQGDGNGVIEGNISGVVGGAHEKAGETMMFWSDLGQASLIDGSFTYASSTALPPITPVTNSSTPSISNYYPLAKIGLGNFILVYSGGVGLSVSVGAGTSNGINYFCIEQIPTLSPFTGVFNIPVQEVYNIDKKVDDGLPETGNITAMAKGGEYGVQWLQSDNGPSDTTTSITQSSATCYDNGGVATTPRTYSLGKLANSGAGANCAFSSRFQ